MVKIGDKCGDLWVIGDFHQMYVKINVVIYGLLEIFIKCM